MLDRTIPFHNTILRCDAYHPRKVCLPSGFSIIPYEKGFEKAWAKMEHSLGDFDSLEAAENYFTATYLQEGFSHLQERARFLVNEQHEIIGSCIAWDDPRQDAFVPSLHWLVVDERYQGIGLGRALCCEIMNIFDSAGQYPIYVHTQPWSWKAIFLYISLGFKLQKNDTFSAYTNEYAQSLQALKPLVTDKQFALLKASSEF